MNKLEYPKTVFNKQEVLFEKNRFKCPDKWKIKETDESYWLVKNDEHLDNIIKNILR